MSDPLRDRAIDEAYRRDMDAPAVGRPAVPAPSEDPVYEPFGVWEKGQSVEQLRAHIVRALNLPPLVPPQADDETIRILNAAWSALSDLCVLARREARDG